MTSDPLIRPASILGFDWSRPVVMGILNVTPDSFSDGGQFTDATQAVAHALAMIKDGADMIDVGGESTRPGAEPVGLLEEMGRVLPVIESLRKETDARISIDTRKAKVMHEAVAAGADLVNDVSALTYDPDSLDTVARLDVPVVLMHAQGDPKTMQAAPYYEDVVRDVSEYLRSRIEVCEAAGIGRERIITDPGIGFGKTLAHNLALIARLDELHELGCPVLLGVSRKSFIAKLDQSAADMRLGGSLAAMLAGLKRGANIVRVHDVAETIQAIRVWRAVEEIGT